MKRKPDILTFLKAVAHSTNPHDFWEMWRDKKLAMGLSPKRKSAFLRIVGVHAGRYTLFKSYASIAAAKKGLAKSLVDLLIRDPSL